MNLSKSIASFLLSSFALLAVASVARAGGPIGGSCCPSHKAEAPAAAVPAAAKPEKVSKASVCSKGECAPDKSCCSSASCSAEACAGTSSKSCCGGTSPECKGGSCSKGACDAPEASLREMLDAKREVLMTSLPPEMLSTIKSGYETIAQSGVLEKALLPGAVAPNFTLPSADGSKVELYALLEQGPVVLTWYRGGWCPYCNLQLSYLSRKVEDFKAAGAQLVAISPEIPDRSLSTKERNGIPFYVLSDTGSSVAEAYGVVYTLPPEMHAVYNQIVAVDEANGDTSGRLPLAATFIIGKDRTIAWAFIDLDPSKRAEPADILYALGK